MLKFALAALSMAGCADDDRTQTSALSAGTTEGPISTGTNGSEGNETTQSPETTEDINQTSFDTTNTTNEITETSNDGTESSTTSEFFCFEGEKICEDGMLKVCQDEEFIPQEACENECTPNLGCVKCLPNSLQCDAEGNSEKCKDDGSDWEDYEVCESVQGLECNEENGKCTGACSKENLQFSNVGCDYWATTLQQADDHIMPPAFSAEAALVNTADEVAHIQMKQNNQVISEAEIPAQSVITMPMPWVQDLVEGNGPTKIVPNGAYHFLSDQPIAFYTYNTFEGNISDDASVLTPVNAQGKEYMAASWPSWVQGTENYAGFYSVIASQNNTHITLTGSPSSLTQVGDGIDEFGNGEVILNAGDVLQVSGALEDGADLSGSLINADKPIQVFGGHECAQVEEDAICGRLEDSMYPTNTLGKTHVIIPPTMYSDPEAEKPQTVRVIAVEPGTMVEFSHDPELNTFLVETGQFVDVPGNVDKFVVKSDKRVMVSQYSISSNESLGGSPAEVINVSQEQWKKRYDIFAPPEWDTNGVDIVAPIGAQVSADGNVVDAWLPIENTDYVYAHLPLSNEGSGRHVIESDQKVGANIRGTRYEGTHWTSAGLNLEPIPG